MSTVVNREEDKYLRKKLRNNLTKPEQEFWCYLRKRQQKGVKFRRQCSIGKYIVDFYSFEKKLVIEIDGDSHYEKESKMKDERRTEFLEKQGIKVLRFTNTEVMKNIEGCLEILQKFLK